ncbi:MAG: hypothetical protein WCA89_14720, partial [Terracidiphilus sp.]
VADAPAQWLPKLDAIALNCLSQDCLNSDPSPAAAPAIRWLRLAPRYLGRLAQGARLLRCNEKTAARFRDQIQEQVERAEIGVTVNLTLNLREQSERYCFAPLTR